MNSVKSNNEPLVSIVIPTYKRLDFLKTTIDAIRLQNYKNSEIFVVADGHQPEVEEHILSLRDVRVRYLACDFAGRPAVARNLGINHSNGEFIALCDDDDVWLPAKLSTQLDFMQQHGIDFSFTAAGVIDENGKKLDQPSVGYREKISLNWFLRSLGNNIYPSTVMIRRANLAHSGLFDEAPDLRGVEDYELFARVLTKTSGFGIEKELVLYRGHSGSIQERNVLPWLRKQLRLQSVLSQTKEFSRWALVFRRMRVYYWALRVALDSLFSNLHPKRAAARRTQSS